MAEGENGIRPGEVDKKVIARLDNESPVLQQARRLWARAIIRERLADFARAQAMVLGDAWAEGGASGLWDEMPLAAKEYEVSRLDGDGGETTLGDGVPVC